MVEITVKFLAGLRLEMGRPSQTISLPENATMADLEDHLRALGFNPDAGEVIIVVNNRGLGQWPPDRPLSNQDVVSIFPHISGGWR